MTDDPFSQWHRYLQAAAAVPPSSPDFAEAQNAVHEAALRIRGLMRTANASDQQDLATELNANSAGTRAAGVAKGTGEQILGGAAQMAGIVGELPPPLTDFLSRLGSEAGGRLGLAVKGTNPEEYQRAADANPWSAFQGEIAPVVGSTALSLMVPNVRRATARGVDRALKANAPIEFTLADNLPPERGPNISPRPSLRPAAGRSGSSLPGLSRATQLPIRGTVQAGAPGNPPPGNSPPLPDVEIPEQAIHQNPGARPSPDPLDTPTFQRRGSVQQDAEVMQRALQRNSYSTRQMPGGKPLPAARAKQASQAAEQIQNLTDEQLQQAKGLTGGNRQLMSLINRELKRRAAAPVESPPTRGNL